MRFIKIVKHFFYMHCIIKCDKVESGTFGYAAFTYSRQPVVNWLQIPRDLSIHAKIWYKLSHNPTKLTPILFSNSLR